MIRHDCPVPLRSPRPDDSAVTVTIEVVATHLCGTTTVVHDTIHTVGADLDEMDAEGGWTDVHVYRLTVVTTRREIGDPR